MKRPNRKWYFIADAHLKPTTIPFEGKRQARLRDFLIQCLNDADCAGLFILGDLFDFWYEYRYYIPKHFFQIYRIMEEFPQHGKELHYFAGNHDFQLGTFFSETLKITTHDQPWIWQVDGKRYLLDHGDGRAPADKGYRLLKKILRNPLCQAFFSLIHPDWGMRSGMSASSISRQANHDPELEIDELKIDPYIEWAVKTLEETDFDGIIIAHTHHAHHEQIDKKLFISLGPWLHKESYMVYQAGQFSFHTYQQEYSNGIAIP